MTNLSASSGAPDATMHFESLKFVVATDGALVHAEPPAPLPFLTACVVIEAGNGTHDGRPPGQATLAATRGVPRPDTNPE